MEMEKGESYQIAMKHNRRRSSIDMSVDNNLQQMINELDEIIEPCGSAITTILKRDYGNKE